MYVWDNENIDRILRNVPELGITRRHIDQVFRALPKHQWFSATMDLFREARFHPRLKKAEIGTLVIFYLRDGRKPRGQYYRGLRALERDLSNEPPELFFVPREKRGDWKIKPSKEPVFVEEDSVTEYFYEERRADGDEAPYFMRGHLLCPTEIKWMSR